MPPLREEKQPAGSRNSPRRFVVDMAVKRSIVDSEVYRLVDSTSIISGYSGGARSETVQTDFACSGVGYGGSRSAVAAAAAVGCSPFSQHAGSRGYLRRLSGR